MKKSIIAIGLCSVLYAQTFPPVQTDAEAQKALNFLTDSSDKVGFTYKGTIGALDNLDLPLSYYSTADYWGKYVGTLPGNDLTVVDVYNGNDYTLTPDPTSPGGDLQVERVNVYNGTDIYDAACWQVALAVCAKGGLKSLSGTNLFNMAANQDTLLKVGYDGNSSQVQPDANRATTQANGTFTYNGQRIQTPNNAYFFRMVTRNWLSTDPFLGTPYMKYVTAQGLPPSSDYEAGKITWLDWKPITGENAWAFFIGPLQAAYLQEKTNGSHYVPFASTAVQNAVGALFALRCMQSELGGIYYACKGSLGNQGDQPVNPYEVSVENNASALGGLKIFQQILNDELQYESDLTAEQKKQVEETLADIKTMIHGGTTPQGKQTAGLLSFFKNQAWDANDGIFYQGGLANDPKESSDWVPTVEPKAVDVSTWGIAVLGQPLLDSWHGFGTAYKVWEDVKNWGGFFGPDKTIWGVGYSDKDGNGSSGDYKKGIISAEWTAGAINLLRCLIVQYGESKEPQAKQYVANLQKDHDNMFKHLMSLRSDQYPTAAAYNTTRPADYSNLVPIPKDKLAFIYASKRYMIPFGWFANPLPSTTSTSWTLMLHFNYNPFKAGGDYKAYSYSG
ncbi:MAG: hypothetical protein S4CHLAM81_05750 [Chlamydiales bacterium]|nr:hypothetical protein [Chlamydiales bacterium]MCH9635360.1 hypothetical protein [Chlamydiales bacterium]MCH9704005.1 hypothetical protein [Chlamydiota bacterium]